mmetsp:Transcript_26888/g.72503  ORF Transcript_26888/g.72503 Transcript_26888/m.72503 type:complete len:181 (+) Transcript_26888:82-624(+)
MDALRGTNLSNFAPTRAQLPSVPPLDDEDSGDDEPVLGRQTLKQWSQDIVDKGQTTSQSVQLRGRGASLGPQSMANAQATQGNSNGVGFDHDGGSRRGSNASLIGGVDRRRSGSGMHLQSRKDSARHGQGGKLLQLTEEQIKQQTWGTILGAQQSMRHGGLSTGGHMGIGGSGGVGNHAL